jgi:hypothetical protein
MKTFLSRLITHAPRALVGIAVLAAVSLPTGALAVTNSVSFDLANYGATSVSRKLVRIEPTTDTFPRADGNTVIGRDYGFVRTDANGKFTNSMVTGTYKITFTNNFVASVFQITVPDTNFSGILTAAELTSTGTNLPSNLAGYSQTAANSMFAKRTNAFQIMLTNSVAMHTNRGFTNIDWVSGVTGFVSGATIKLGVDVAAAGGISAATATNIVNANAIAIQSGNGNATTLTNATLRANATNDPLIVRDASGRAILSFGTNNILWLGTNGSFDSQTAVLLLFPLAGGSNQIGIPFTNGAQYGIRQLGTYRTETAGSNYTDSTWSLGWNLEGKNNTEPIAGLQMEAAYRNSTNDAFLWETFWSVTGTNRAYSQRPWGFTANRSNGVAYTINQYSENLSIYGGTSTEPRLQMTSGNSWYFWSPVFGSNAILCVAGDGKVAPVTITYPLAARTNTTVGLPLALVITNFWNDNLTLTAPNAQAGGDDLALRLRAVGNGYSLDWVANYYNDAIIESYRWLLHQTNSGNAYSNVMVIDRGRVGINLPLVAAGITPTNGFDVNAHSGFRSNVWMHGLKTNASVVSYVGKTTGGELVETAVPAASGGTNTLFSTNGVTLGSAGTVNWTAGVTGYLAGAIAHLGVNVTGSGAAAIGWQTNGVDAATNANVFVVSNTASILWNAHSNNSGRVSFIADVATGVTNGLNTRVGNLEGVTNSFVTLTTAQDITGSKSIGSLTNKTNATLSGQFIRTVQRLGNGTVPAASNNFVIVTNADFTLDFAGTRTTGDRFGLAISNYNENTDITVTWPGNVYDSTGYVGASVLKSNAVYSWEFEYLTNGGSNTFYMVPKVYPTYSLVAGVGLGFATNYYTITLTNTGAAFLTNWANSISNLVQTKQYGTAALSNIANITKTAEVVSGAGNGNTNYLLTLSTNALNDFYLGSSNVHIYTVGGSTLGSPIFWTASITNLSAISWGINFSSLTNRWRYSGIYGTNAPSVLTNGTCLMLAGRTDGTNCTVGYTYFAPGL